MIDILLISDQPRLHAILKASSDLPGGVFRIATSLVQGEHELSKGSPDLLFLQNRFSGLAGSILVRHVRSQLGESRSRIVLLADGSEAAGDSTADLELDISVADIELSDAIAELISDCMTQAPPSSSPSLEQQPVAAPTAAQPAPVIAAEIDDSVSLTPVAQELAGSDREMNRPAKGDPLPPPSAILPSTPPPLQWERKRVTIAGSILAAICIAGLFSWLYWGKSPRPQPKPASAKPEQIVQPALSTSSHAKTPQQPAPDQTVTPLPAFIPTGGRDQSYGTSNPGWERYTTASREFKIHREQGEIKALQVFDRSGDGIPPAFFSSTLQSMAGIRDYRLETKERKGEFLVKRGRLTGNSRLILYKDPSDRLLRAFVIYFESGGQASDSTRKGTK